MLWCGVVWFGDLCCTFDILDCVVGCQLACMGSSFGVNVGVRFLGYPRHYAL